MLTPLVLVLAPPQPPPLHLEDSIRRAEPGLKPRIFSEDVEKITHWPPPASSALHSVHSRSVFRLELKRKYLLLA